MEEPSGTGSRGVSRDPTSAGAAVLATAATAAPYQPHRRCQSRFLDARSMARRASRHPNGWSSGRAETTVPEDTSSNDPNAGRRSAPRGRWRDRLGFFGLLVDGQSRPIWASLVRVADHIRAGMEVMSTEDDH